jgi:hypothetical protein
MIGVTLYFAWPIIKENDIPQPVKTDSYGYVLMGYNLYHDGVYSDGCVDYRAPCDPLTLKPTSYREPAYSL